MVNIAILTPLKDEIENLQPLINSVESQSIRINHWVIIENDSTDGSKEFLSSVQRLNNVGQLSVINLEFEDRSYQLGLKYSIIIEHGIKYLKDNDNYEQIDYVGILDADCHPESDYYRKLIAHFEGDPSLGIASGVIRYKDNTPEVSNYDHARGGCRLWRKVCLNDSPYEVGLSADAISSAKAIINGWKVRSFEDAVVFSRKAGSRYISAYLGYSAYYRHIPFYYVFLKSAMYIFKGNASNGMGILTGYIKALLQRHPRLDDPRLVHHYKNILFRKYRERRSRNRL